MEEIELCPFCSAKADYYFEFGNPDKDGYWVKGQICCDNCGARGPIVTDDKGAREKGIKAWNKRA